MYEMYMLFVASFKRIAVCRPPGGKIHLALFIPKARKARAHNKKKRSPSFYFFENSPMWDEVDGGKGG